MVRGEHGNVTVLSGSSSSFVPSLFLFHANTKKKKKRLLHFFPLLLVSPSSSSPLCSPSGEPVSECRRYVQLRNITKGDCRLDNVEVSFCRGRCLSRTDVTLEVRKRERDLCTPTHRRYCSHVTCYWQLLIDTGVTTGSTLKGQCRQKSALQELVVVIKLQSQFWM